MKKLASLLLALVIVLSLAMPAFAAGVDGKITIKDSSTVNVADKTFKAYRILELSLDATDTHHAYTVPAGLKDFYKDYAWPEEKDTDGKVVAGTGKFTEAELNSLDLTFDELVYQRLSKMDDNSQALYEFATAALAAAKTANITPETKTGAANATSVVFENLPLGYYLVEDATKATDTTIPISALILDTTKRNVDVNIKADKPTLDKDIDGNNDTDSDTSGQVDMNTAAIGDKVPFVIDTAVPDMTGYALYEKYYFVITDTLSNGLTYNHTTSNMTIQIGSSTLTEKVGETGTGDYTVTVTTQESGETTVEIVFLDFYKKWKDAKGQAIKVTYDAILNENAQIGDTGNKNTAKLTYSNNPNVNDEGTPDNPDKPDKDSPVGETPDSDTYTYVTELVIKKVNEKQEPLTGAEFTVEGTTMNTILVSETVFEKSETGTYYLLTNGTYTTTAPTDDTAHFYASTTDKYTKTEKTETVTKPAANEENKFLYSVKVNEDGNLILTGLQQGTYTITETKSPAGYNMLKSPITVTIDWVAPTGISTNCDWTYTLTANDATDKTDDDVSNTDNTITVVNNAGLELPSTGGMGTTLFYIVGAGLMLAAAVLLVTKKRMSNN